MARLTQFILCEKIENIVAANGQQISSLVNPLAFLRPQLLPSAFSFGVSIGVQGVEVSRPCEISISLLDSNGAALGNTLEATLPPPAQEIGIPDEELGFVINLDMHNALLRTPGKYSFEVRVNGVAIGSREFGVYLRSDA